MGDDTAKRCTQCGAVKPLDEFHKRARAADGRQSRCKECAKQLAREWYLANRERADAATRKRRESNREAHLQYHREYYAKNRDRWMTEEVRAAARRRSKERWAARRADPEWVALKKRQDRESYVRNREDRIARVKAYAESRKDDPKFKQAKRISGSVRRVRRLGNGVFKVTAKDIERLIARFDGRCAYCRRAQWEHIDHAIPIARGGRHSIGNLVPACAACNLSKWAYLPVEFRFNR